MLVYIYKLASYFGAKSIVKMIIITNARFTSSASA